MTFAAAAFLVTGATAGPAASAPVAAVTSTAAEEPSATVSMYAGNAGTQSPGESVTVTVVVGNTTSKFIGSGTATISITQGSLASRAELDAWLKPDGTHAATRAVAAPATTGVGAGTTSRVATVTIPAANVALSAAATTVYGLQATVVDSAGTVGTAYSTLSLVGTGTQHTVGLAMAMPITVPATADGLISSDDLAAYTGPAGLLTRELNLAADHSSIATAIDPMIIASIRVLGSAAPTSAQQWLHSLDELSNDSFPLQYGDADVASQLQSGITTLLQPTAFGYAIDPKNFSTPITVGETPAPIPTSTPTTNPFVTPTSTPTAPQTNVPTMEQLLAWPYTFSGIAWPADASLRGSDIEALAAAGYKSTIVSGSNTNQSTLQTTPNAPLPVKGGTALVTDEGISTAMRTLVTAAGVDEQNAALAEVSARLAEVSAQGSVGTVLLAGLGREWPSGSADAEQALSAVFDLPWVTASSLRAALDAPVTSGLQIKDSTQEATRTATVNRMVSDAGQVDAFATVLDDPTFLTGDIRNQLLSLLGVGWMQADDNWPSAVAGFEKRTVDPAKGVVNSVQIVPTGKITVASTQSLIPVTVTNDYSLPVNIVLRATPSNGRLEVDSDTAKTIPAKASAKVLVPVKAKLGNGNVHLSLQLYSPTGITIGAGRTSAIEVHADWEGIGALILGIAVVLFFGFGLVRSILRRRRSRRSGVDDPDTTPGSEQPRG